MRRLGSAGSSDQAVGAADPHLWMDPLAIKDVVAALTALGYTASEAAKAVSVLPHDKDLSLEEKLRLALQRLGSR